MKKYLSFLFLSFCVSAFSQPLRDINYDYLYNPDAQVHLQLKTMRGPESYTILYNLQVKDTVGLMNEYSIQWEARNLLNDKEGTPVALNDVVVSRHASGLQGRGTFDRATAPRHFVAKVIHPTTKRAWLFYTTLEPNYPANNYLQRNGSPVTQRFIHTHEKVEPGADADGWVVSYYDDDFPAAAPAFSEAQTRVSRVMAVDSVFSLGSGEINFPMKGLYLIQKDTNAIEGLAFRSEEDYPQYSKVANLAGPLVYITTKQEYDRLESSRGNKKAFDRVILAITMDTERARILMRNYFRKVELANRYFTSYKEGWKTDRGMIYIIFGAPGQVFKFDDREVWSYDTNQFDIRFTFSRASSLFDPDNFVLIREKKYEDTWYEVIDLWRNARF